jgi:hypothetical protein
MPRSARLLRRWPLGASGLVVAGILTVIVADLALPPRPSGARPESDVMASVGSESVAVASRPKGTNAWRLSRPATGRQIEGFVTKVSEVPGSRVGLKVSTSARRYRVRAHRLGWYPGGTGHLVWPSALLRGRRQACRQRSKMRPMRRSKTRPPVRRFLVCRVLGSDAGQGVDPAVA